MISLLILLIKKGIPGMINKITIPYPNIQVEMQNNPHSKKINQSVITLV